MKNRYRSRATVLTANIFRYILAVCFIFSGFVKAVDPVGTQIKFQDYLQAFSVHFLTSSDVLLVACLLAGLEFLIGVYLFFGVYGKGTSIVTLTILLLFTPFTLYLALKNPVSDCGCFGDALILTNWQTFAKNVILLIMAFLLFLWNDCVKPLISEYRAWLVPVVSVLLIGHFMLGNIRDLPVFDFRPYKVGTDLRKNIEANRESAYAEFSLMNERMEDVTDRILSDSSYVFLMVSPYLGEASQENIDVINEMSYYCQEKGYKMYGVTSSGNLEIRRWKDVTFSEYDFLYSDEVLLKTMIRSNPGIIVLEDGKIVAKWSDSNIPVSFSTSTRMENLELSHPFLASVTGRYLFIVIYFMFPYVLILLIDRCRKREKWLLLR